MLASAVDGLAANRGRQTRVPGPGTSEWESRQERSRRVTALLSLIESLLFACERLFLVLANGCLAVMMLINIINVILRGFVTQGLTSVFPWSVVLMVWMTFLGFFLLYRKRKDITVDFLVDR